MTTFRKLRLKKPITKSPSKFQIIKADCRDAVPNLPAESFDCIITSPPYKKADGWDPEWFSTFCLDLYNLLKPGRLFFLNFGDLAEDRTGYMDAAQAAIGGGFELIRTVILEKRQYSPLPKSVNVGLDVRHEYCFILGKGPVSKLKPWNRWAIGIPYEDKSNAARFNKGADLKCRGTVWRFAYETIQSESQKLHPHRFPLEFPETCIKLANLPKGAAILDPFLGSGTTLVAAKRLGMTGTGIEVDPAHCKTAKIRLAK